MTGDTTDLVPVTGQLVEHGVLGTQEVLARVTRVLEIQKAVMKEGIHFGTIPGTPRPTLYKAGAEKLLMTFRIGHRAIEIGDLSTADERRYRVTVEGFNQQTGAALGSATGECSSSEEKYRWRRPVCDEEWNEMPEDRRREVWKRGKEKNYKAKQVRTAPADVANTILQMADKRGLVQMTRVVLACSDLFDQDLEDMPEALRESLLEGQEKAEPKKEPQRASATTGRVKPTNGDGKPIAKAEKPEVPTELSKPTTIQGMHEQKGPNGTFYVVNTAAQDYTLFDAALADQLVSCVGTPQQIVLRYTTRKKGDKTYRNVVSFAVAESTEVPPPAATDPLSQDDIRWG